MPINTKGGKGHKKGKNKPVVDRQLLIARDGPEQNYGLITKALGDLRMSLIDPDSQTYVARIRGKMKGRQRIRPGDLVLFSYRQTGEKKVDIIMKYNEEQAKRIIRSEGISFPDGDHAFGSRNANSNIVFDDDVDVHDSTINTETVLSGAERIQAIYAESSCEDEESDDENYDDDETYDDDENDDVTIDSASDSDQDTEKKIDHRKKTIAQKAKAADRNAKTAAHFLSKDCDIDIDAI